MTLTLRDAELLTDIDLLYPSKYLKAADLLGRDVTVTIEAIEPRHELKGSRGAEYKPVCRLAKTDKLLVLNKTNAATIATMYGRKPQDWIGKRVALYSADVRVGPDMRPAIRVRDRVPAAGKAKVQAEAPAAQAAPAHDPVTGEVDDTIPGKEW